MRDEGFHEIQLNGKQLVFLFMAATVVAVVIFLCGVMVGRGVPAQRVEAFADVPEQPPLDPTAGVQPSPSSSSGSNTGRTPLTVDETLTYPNRLEAPTPLTETLKPAAEQDPLPAPRAVATAARETPSALAPPAAVDPALKEPPGRGFVVQVAAVRKRAEAETIARRLSSKGYPTFVTTSGANFRVRVGKYDNRREAEATAGRLEREEHFKPWLTQ